MAEPNGEGSALDRLLALREEIQERLAQNSDYKALVAVNRAIAEISGDAPREQDDAPREAKQKASQAADVSGLSQADASHLLLTKVLREPVVISNLVRALNAHGVHVGGTNPNINLSSTLSKDGRFRSVRYRDRSSWWVKGAPYPGELDIK